MGFTDNTTFTTPGSHEIVFEREAGEDDDFKPIAPDGNIRFFGRVNIGGGDADAYGPFEDIGHLVKLDEDVVSGETEDGDDAGDTPPAIRLNVSIDRSGGSANAGVQLQLIYYETSGIEYIQGADECFMGVRSADRMDTHVAQAMCITDEESFSLYAETDTDAGDTKRDLVLVETGLFTGVFQGELRLTDADGVGDGSNWGRMRGDAMYDADLDIAGVGEKAAVIGVNAGPVTIKYKDTDKQTRSYDIDIDITPPTIQIDSPAHGDRSDDEKPSFTGSFNDADSGLVSNSFQLNVDNTDDRQDGGEKVPVLKIDAVVAGPGSDHPVRRRLDYTGANGAFGVIPAGINMEMGGTAGSTQGPDPAVGATRGYPAGYEGVIYRGEIGDGYNAYKSVDSDDFSNGAHDGEFNDEVEIDFDEEGQTDSDFNGFNNAVDFQAAVRDLAGNIGFSDSDPANPRFINALGEEKSEDRDPNGTKHNVLGVFSRHIVWIDELDPYIKENRSVTGFYGMDSDDNLIRDRSAVMVVFDNEIEGSLIDTSTFSLEHDEDTPIAIADVMVDGNLVFLKLDEELKSDATPTLRITEGREVEDKAGNLLRSEESLYGTDSDDTVKEITVKDGILPVLTLTLSGGSGTGVGSEGSAKLTNGAMDVEIVSDEDINGSPFVSVVCSNIGWGTGDDAMDFDDYLSNRTGNVDNGATPEGLTPELKCGGDANPVEFRNTRSLSRPGNVWIYAWRNAEQSAESRHLNDGELVVVAWARDRSEYESDDDGMNIKNWGSVTARFVLDDTFHSPKNHMGGTVQPNDGAEVTEPRPFVTLDFAGEATTVKVSEFMVDGTDALSSLENIGENRFLYWPEELEFGEHEVEFAASDAADNDLPGGSDSFKFNVMARDPFVLDITAGWNAISFPANPVDSAVDAVFTEEAVDRVVGWNPTSSTGPWSMASRIDGVWTTNMDFAPLTEIEVRYGYWVHSTAFVKQSVQLEGPVNRETSPNPHPYGIITVAGWNFVGVIDQDGDQTEGAAGDELKGFDDGEATDAVKAKDYLAGYRQAYTWDAIAHGYKVLQGDDSIKIGDGIWVFFPDQNAIAP